MNLELGVGVFCQSKSLCLIWNDFLDFGLLVWLYFLFFFLRIKIVPLSLVHCSPGQHSGTHSVPHKEFWVPHCLLILHWEKTENDFYYTLSSLRMISCELPCNGEDKTVVVYIRRSVNNTIKLSLSLKPLISQFLWEWSLSIQRKYKVWRTQNDFIWNILSVSINFLTHAEFPTTNTTFLLHYNCSNRRRCIIFLGKGWFKIC